MSHSSAGDAAHAAPRATPPGVRRVVAFAAHPDDIDFGASGTIARLTQEGTEVRYVVMTAGDAGGYRDEDRGDIVERRTREQSEAAAELGVHGVEVWDEPDGLLEPSLEVQRRVVRTLREFRPELVLCPHPERDYARIHRSHPDHLACGEAVTRAVYPALENPYAFPELEAAGLHAYKLPHLWFYGSPRERENHWVSVDTTLPRKLTALERHLSQHPDLPGMRRFVEEQLQAQAAQAHEAGVEAGTLAEAFHAVTVSGPGTIAGF